MKTRISKLTGGKCFYLVAAVLLMSSRSNAQTSELGFGALFFKQQGTLILTYDPGSTTGNINYPSEIEESNAVPGFCFVHYHPFYELSDNMALGGEGGLNFFAYFKKEDDVQNFYGQTIASGESSGLYIAYQVPLYAAIRFMNGSTENNDEGFGAGAGIGVMAQGFEVPDEKGFMFTPSVMVELKYNRVGARFDYLFNKFESNYTSDTGDIPRLTTSFFNIVIMLTL